MMIMQWNDEKTSSKRFLIQNNFTFFILFYWSLKISSQIKSRIKERKKKLKRKCESCFDVVLILIKFEVDQTSVNHVYSWSTEWTTNAQVGQTYTVVINVTDAKYNWKPDSSTTS